MMEEQKDADSMSAQLKVIKKIGIGAQSEVYQVQHISSGLHYALKIIPISNIQSVENKRVQFEILSNLYISQQAKSPFFPKLFHYWVEPTTVNLLFQLCQQNAETGFKKLSTYNQRYNYVFVLLFDILRALSNLQAINIIHRDIKPQNILIKKSIFKLSDLGLSRISQNGKNLTNNIGNKLGRSPQFITGNYTTKTDVWSLGIHLFYMLEGTLPFDELSLLKIKNNPYEIQKIISSPNLVIDLQPIGRKSKNVLSFLHFIWSQMTAIEPNNRSKASQIINNYFPHNMQLVESHIVRILLINYLYERDSYGQYFLILLLGHIDFYRLDSKMKDQSQVNKKKICLKVKCTILQIVRKTNIIIQSFDHQLLHSLSQFIIKQWQLQLANQGIQGVNQLYQIDEALNLYKITKVKQKFPFIEIMVKLYKICEQLTHGVQVKRLNLWEIPLQICKIL